MLNWYESGMLSLLDLFHIYKKRSFVSCFILSVFVDIQTRILADKRLLKQFIRLETSTRKMRFFYFLKTKSKQFLCHTPNKEISSGKIDFLSTKKTAGHIDKSKFIDLPRFFST